MQNSLYYTSFSVSKVEHADWLNGTDLRKMLQKACPVGTSENSPAMMDIKKLIG